MFRPSIAERCTAMTDHQGHRLTQAHPLRNDEHDAAAELFARCFAEELWCAALLEVLPSLKERHAFLLGSCQTEMAGFAAWAGVLVVSSERDNDAGTDGGAGRAVDLSAESAVDASGSTGTPVGLILIGSRDAPTASGLNALHEQGFVEGCRNLPVHSRDALKARLEQMRDLSNGSWMGRFCTGDFRYIASICVDEAYRGTGVFGRLMDPLIAECDRLRIPLCLECYSERLVALYGNRGFEVVSTVHNRELNLTEYCMIRPPHQ
jgi:GNAT superfamily N-acetyltransferase